jgi:hypothetical protein
MTALRQKQPYEIVASLSSTRICRQNTALAIDRRGGRAGGGPSRRWSLARQKRSLHNQSLRENCKKISGQTKSAGSMAQHYEFVIDFQNALGRLYIRYLNPPLG